MWRMSKLDDCESESGTKMGVEVESESGAKWTVEGPSLD